jgi:hypothetical protein
VVLVVLASTAACVRREGRNDNCEWPNEKIAPLDIDNPAHRRHVTVDAQFAEELGIRHGDSFRGQETIEERGRRVEACTDRLLAWIVVLHSVSPDDVQRARAARDWRVDAITVFSPMLIVFCTAAIAVMDRIRRRFSPGERTPMLVTIAAASVVLSLAALLAGELWSWLVEIVRVGDSHLSYRAFRIPWTRHRLAIFAAGVVIFWLVAWLNRRREPASSAGDPGIN